MTADQQGSSGPTDSLLDQAEQMIWNMLDDNLPEGDVQKLETLIQENEQVRSLYVDCVQMHADLSDYFGQIPEPGVPQPPKSPVLGSLGDTMPDANTGRPVTD